MELLNSITGKVTAGVVALAVIAATPGTAQAKSDLVTARNITPQPAKCVPGPGGTVRAEVTVKMGDIVEVELQFEP